MKALLVLFVLTLTSSAFAIENLEGEGLCAQGRSTAQASVDAPASSSTVSVDEQ
ncbi:MAG: hypothetical protein JNM93_10605 [Bacteriovoracaceae bacterium]|nr:hypothetical protein [Bacteriovoracaceae bacterium]